MAPPDSVAGLAQAPPSQCELHIWPTKRFHVLTTSWWSAQGGLLPIALDVSGHANGDSKRGEMLANALDGASQLAALQAANPGWALDRPSYRVVTHNVVLDPKTVDKIKERRFASTSPCYAELIVADMRYRKMALYGRSLRTLFIFREFGSASTVKRITKGWGGNRLQIFPPQGEFEVDLAARELAEVFQMNFKEFGRNAPALSEQDPFSRYERALVPGVLVPAYRPELLP